MKTLHLGLLIFIVGVVWQVAAEKPILWLAVLAAGYLQQDFARHPEHWRWVD